MVRPLDLVRVEITVRTLTHAPRQVHIQRKWRRDQHGQQWDGDEETEANAQQKQGQGFRELAARKTSRKRQYRQAGPSALHHNGSETTHTKPVCKEKQSAGHPSVAYGIDQAIILCKRSRNCSSARARWLIWFFNSASISAAVTPYNGSKKTGL